MVVIKILMNGKFVYWGLILKDNVFKMFVLFDVLYVDYFMLEGCIIEIKGLNGLDVVCIYLWILLIKIVVGGVVVNSGDYVWVVDM